MSKRKISVPMEPPEEAKPERLRGGCFDTLVQILSLGFLGVETTAMRGFKDEVSGKVYSKGNPMALALNTKNIVYVATDEETHILERKFVKNQKVFPFFPQV